MAVEKLEIVYRDPATLTPYDKNSNTHPPDQIIQLTKSIQQFGFTNPVALDENGMMLAGHGRTKAAVALGLKLIPTVTLAGLSDAEKRAYVIADNKLGQNSVWDDAMLKEELQGLAMEGFDLTTTGFTDDELTNFDLGTAPEEKAAEPDDVPEQTAVVHYDIVFDTAAQQDRFYQLLKLLKTTYPDTPTVAGRLDQYIQDRGA